jgi:hypothetical protein
LKLILNFLSVDIIILRMRKFYILTKVLLCLSSICYGQKLLFHKNRHRQAFYKEGDVISFRLKNDKSKITGQIRGFEDSLIVFLDFKIDPKKITHLYVDGKTKSWYILRYKYEKMFLIAGVGYPLLELVNNGEVDKEVLIIGGSLITAGLFTRWLISDKIKIKGRRRILIID